MRRAALTLAVIAAVALAADLAVAGESSHRGGQASITLVQHRGQSGHSGHHGRGPSSYHGRGPSSYHRGYRQAPSPHYYHRGPSVHVRPPARYRYPAHPPVYRYPSYYPYGYRSYYPYSGFQYYGNGYGFSIGF